MAHDVLIQRLKQIVSYISALTQECHVLDQRRHLLAPLIQDAEIMAALKRKLEGCYGVSAWNHLAPLLGQDLVRDQARLFLDNNHQSGSLRNLWRKLTADPAIKDRFRRDYGRMLSRSFSRAIAGLPDGPSTAERKLLQEQQCQEDYAAFDSGWGRTEAFVVGLPSNPIAVKIRTLRDKYHAHLEMANLDETPAAFNPNDVGLTFEEVFAFNDYCQGIVAELGGLLTGQSWDPKRFAEAHAMQGRDMWMNLSR